MIFHVPCNSRNQSVLKLYPIRLMFKQQNPLRNLFLVSTLFQVSFIKEKPMVFYKMIRNLAKIHSCGASASV